MGCFFDSCSYCSVLLHHLQDCPLETWIQVFNFDAAVSPHLRFEVNSRCVIKDLIHDCCVFTKPLLNVDSSWPVLFAALFYNEGAHVFVPFYESLWLGGIGRLPYQHTDDDVIRCGNQYHIHNELINHFNSAHDCFDNDSDLTAAYITDTSFSQPAQL